MEGILQFDENLLLGIQQALDASWLTPIMRAVSALGDQGLIWIAICLVMICFRKTRNLGIVCALSLGAAFIVCNLVLKPWIARPRPWTVIENYNLYVVPLKDKSFPSGHANASMATAWSMFIATLPGKRNGARSYDYTPCLGWNGIGVSPRSMHMMSVAAIALALLIGLSRVYLGAHYPLDVMGGMLNGMLWATLVNYIFWKRVQRNA